LLYCSYSSSLSRVRQIIPMHKNSVKTLTDNVDYVALHKKMHKNY